MTPSHTGKFLSALLAGMVLALAHHHASATYDEPPAQAPGATSAAAAGARSHAFAAAGALAGSSATGGEATSSAAGGAAAGGVSSISSSTRALGLGWQTANTPNPSAATAQPVGCISRALFEDAWALQRTDPEKAAALLERTYAYPRALGHEGSSPYHVLSFAFGAGDTRPAVAEGKPVPLPLCADVPTPVIVLPHPEVSTPPPPPAAPRKTKRPAALGTCSKRRVAS